MSSASNDINWQELSQRYATDQTYIDPQFYSGMGQVKSSSARDVSSPCLRPELDSLFQTSKANKSVAKIPAPPNFNSQQSSIFVGLIAPSTGNEEMVEINLQKLDDMMGVSTRTVNDKSELDLEKTEKDKLKQFFDCLGVLNTNMSFSTIERNRHQRG